MFRVKDGWHWRQGASASLFSFDQQISPKAAHARSNAALRPTLIPVQFALDMSALVGYFGFDTLSYTLLRGGEWGSADFCVMIMLRSCSST